MRIRILGDGGWGTALAIQLLRKKEPVLMWGPDPLYLKELKRKKVNRKFLPHVRIPSGITYESDINKALDGARVIICAIPSNYLASSLKKINPKIVQKAIFLSATKGFDHKSLKRPSEIVAETLQVKNIAVLSGPTIAKEVALAIPSAATIACKNNNVAKRLQKLISDRHFRLYTSTDIAGVELGGSLKNVIAIAAGISDGLKFGANAKAALLSRGLSEMTRLACRLGAKKETLMGLSGIGDLITTCISLDGRNRSCGVQIGKGQKVSKILRSTEMVIEGVLTTKSTRKLARKARINMPITEEIYKVLFLNKSPRKAVEALMQRELKVE